MCLYGEIYYEEDPYTSLPYNWKNLSDENILKYSNSGKEFSLSSDVYKNNRDFDWYYYPCKIYFLQDDSRLTVGIFNRSGDTPLIFIDYPR